MHCLLALLMLSVACSMVITCVPMRMHCKRNQPIEKSIDSDFLIGLDESLSRCGPYSIDIRELTIFQFQEHFRSGRLTSTELTQCYLKRVDKIDVHLRSVIEINPDAISLARKADRERRANSTLSSMHGIPILIKDNIGTADCMQTTAGAEALQNIKPKQDADVVRRLRKAGAIILGKANLSEWASFRDSSTRNGWSGRGGKTVSPYVMNEDPYGSSTGSAVSVSTNLATVSLGTETDGSIISPSTRNAIVGLKTTFGTVSIKGLIPLSFSRDVIGPMARTVQDAAILLGTISDVDLQGCDEDVSTCMPKKNLSIGVLRKPFWDNSSDPEIAKSLPVLENCLINLNKSKLVLLIDPVISPLPIPDIMDDIYVILQHEFKHSINNYLKHDVDHFESELGRNISTLADIIAYNQMNPPIEGYNQHLLESSQATDDLENASYINAKNAGYNQSILYLDAIFDRYEVDALCSPCHYLLYSYGAFAGYPTISVPVGVDSLGMPFGMCLLGRLNSEPALLKMGHIIELSRLAERPVPHFIGENK